MSRLELGISGTLKECAQDGLKVDEFFLHGSFLSVEAHNAKHNEYPKQWHDLIAFLEKVSPFPWVQYIIGQFLNLILHICNPICLHFLIQITSILLFCTFESQF
jgi:hypothetical protein